MTLPPTFTEETKREFEKEAIEIAKNVFVSKEVPREFKKAFATFIVRLIPIHLSRTTAAYDLRTKEVREIVEGMKQNQPEATHNGISGQDYDYAYNSALSDLLTRLTK